MVAQGEITNEKSAKEIKEAFRKPKLLKDSKNPAMKQARERRSELPTNYDGITPPFFLRAIMRPRESRSGMLEVNCLPATKTL